MCVAKTKSPWVVVREDEFVFDLEVDRWIDLYRTSFYAECGRLLGEESGFIHLNDRLHFCLFDKQVFACCTNVGAQADQS